MKKRHLYLELKVAWIVGWVMWLAVPAMMTVAIVQGNWRWGVSALVVLLMQTLTAQWEKSVLSMLDDFT